MTYICDLCGFLYDEQKQGPWPEEYHCPLCGADSSHFQPDFDSDSE